MAAEMSRSRQCVIWFGLPRRHEREALAAAGWQVRVAMAAEGIGLRGEDIVVGLMDLRDDRADRLERLEQVALRHGYLPLVALAPGGEAIAGVARVLARCVETLFAPLDLARLIRVLDAIVGVRHAGSQRGLDALVGRSPAMRATRSAIRKFAPVDLPVLITGDTGTGKEVAARALHELSARHAMPFCALNCGALASGLVQSELFGHERGAFTGAAARRAGLFETAQGGTVFLDEIGDLPLDTQASLLRVLQEGTLERLGSHQPIAIDVRVLAATNLDLERAVADGRFRSDLFYRLNVLRLHMPGLAERGADVLLLAQHFLDGFRARHGGRARAFSPQARRAMRGCAWPGHVRELLNRVQRAAVVAETELIGVDDLGLADVPAGALATTRADAEAAGTGTLDTARHAAEREAILDCLRESGFNISQTARRLKISRVTVYRLCRRHGLELHKLR